jgi:NhaP-type Na+/H+ or K+/H+ antiporter
MEFNINFGISGVIVGFLLLGLVLGKLDRSAAENDIAGNLGQTFIPFLTAIALIQPNGSIVEMMSGAAAALVAGLAWRWAWVRWPRSVRSRQTPISGPTEPVVI